MYNYCSHLFFTRTPGTGLYDNLKQYRIPEPTAIFDITFFSRNPKPFFTLAQELYPGKYSPNTVHYFIRLLQEKGFLLRNYTQNIDGLERCKANFLHFFRNLISSLLISTCNLITLIPSIISSISLPPVAGIKPGKLVEAHGSFSTASCMLCHAKHNPDDVKVLCVECLPSCISFLVALGTVPRSLFLFLYLRLPS